MGLSAPSATIERRAPRLRGNLAEIIHETNTLGLTSVRNDYMNTTMTGGGAARLEHNVTSLGRKLIEFILRRE